MTMLDDIASAYWDAFRQGYFKVGGRPEEYPEWKSAPLAVKEETLRCLRHAVEPLKVHFTEELWSEVFPEGVVQRGKPMMPNDQAFVRQTELAEKLG